MNKSRKSISVSELGSFAGECEVQALLRYRDSVAKGAVSKESLDGERVHQVKARQAERYEMARRKGSLPGQARDSRCFIATQVYGPAAPETERLREWRDEVLLKTHLGRWFVKLYYTVSPVVCSVIDKVPGLDYLVRRLLDRLVSHLKLVSAR